MTLPSPTALEDAAVQLEYAARCLSPLLEMLTLRCEAPPTNPTNRPRWEQNNALLRALKSYSAAVANAQTQHDEQVQAMRAEMGAAQFRYTELGVERDYLLCELREANGRYYTALDTLTALESRFAPHSHAA